jgi:hypothetical protein
LETQGLGTALANPLWRRILHLPPRRHSRQTNEDTMNSDSVRFNALRNALYHTSRRMTFERWNRWFNFVTILLGAAGVSNFLDSWSLATPQAIGFAVATVGAAQLVFDFGGKARDHQALQRDYYHLLASVEETIAPDAAQIAQWNAQMTKIAGDEPPMLRALDAKAYNDALSAMETFPEDELLVIPWHHRLLGQIWAYEGYRYLKVREWKALRLTKA